MLAAALLAGCGTPEDNEATTGPAAASLDGERRGSVPDKPVVPALDISKAPTEVHGELAKLLPTTKALDRDSIEYAGWDGPSATYDVEDAANAPLPTVAAIYRSMGYSLKTGEEDKGIDVEHPQNATVILVRAPDELAADTLREQIAAQLNAKGFTERDQLELAFGRENVRSIQCFSLVVSGDEVDSVYVAYLETMGNTVLYALETEAVPKLKIDAGTQIDRVANGSFGTRLGGQLLMLILHRMLAN